MGGWLRATFSDPQVLILVGVLVAFMLVLLLVGDVLAPLIAAVVIAYVLEEAVKGLMRAGLSRTFAAALVSLLFLAGTLALLLLLMPLLLNQVAQLARLLPSIITGVQDWLVRLPGEYPELFDAEQVQALIERLRAEVLGFGQLLLVNSVAWIGTLATMLLYAVLVPMLVFFFLKDKDQILSWLLGYLPAHRPLADRVWRELDTKTVSYVRGKIYEILIVAAAVYLVFLALGVPFAALLAAGAGLSTLIPFVGAPLAGVPVAVVAYAEWGFGAGFAWAMAAYTLLQVLDGFVLNPLLLAGVVRLHPNAVVAAILVFGHIWGFWGVFFAVPLASLVQAVLGAWPRGRRSVEP